MYSSEKMVNQRRQAMRRYRKRTRSFNIVVAEMGVVVDVDKWLSEEQEEEEEVVYFFSSHLMTKLAAREVTLAEEPAHF